MKYIQSRNLFFYNTLILGLLVSLFLYSCGSQDVKDISGQNKTIVEKISTNYHPDVVGVSVDGISSGKNAMDVYLLDFYKQHGVSQDFKTHYKIAVNQNLEYEIGSFETERSGSFNNLIISSKQKDSPQRIFEVVYKKTSNQKIPDAITTARNKWMTLCNAHEVGNLVTQLYTKDAIYYNRGRVLIGHEKLEQEYSYMQNPSYSLQLSPKYVEVVSDDMVFEIGQCSGSYPLPYILVWKKQPDGNWKIFIDSNY